MPVALPALPALPVTTVVTAEASAGRPSGRVAPRGWVQYRVRPGDTIFDLAAARRTSMAALVGANHLPGDGRLIRAGQLLLVPAARHQVAAAPRPAYVTRVVRSGDTISDLAAHYRVSPSVLLRANHLDRRGRIYTGQHLRVPTAAARAAAKRPAATTANSFAGRTYPTAIVRAASRNRTALAHRRVPSRLATRDLIVRTARRYGVDPGLALAISWQESGWNQRQVSVANAIGAMQVVPATGDWASSIVGRRLDLLDPADNVTAGVVVLHILLHSSSSRAQAVAGYYQGLGSVQAHGAYPDTKRYVRSVLALQARFD